MEHTDGFNEGHARHLVTAYRHVDEILAEALHLAESPASPLSAYVRDMPARRREMLRHELERLRAQMLGLLDQMGVPLPSPDLSVTWAVRAALISARIAIEETRPRHVRGYGELQGSAADALERAVQTLLAQIDRMDEELARTPPRTTGDSSATTAGPQETP